MPREFTEQLPIRFTPLQRALVERAAALREETLAEFCRNAALTRARRLLQKVTPAEAAGRGSGT